MTTLVPLEADSPDFDSWLQQLKITREWVASHSTLSEATNAREQAHLIRELVRMRNEGHRAAVEALRLECAALRRLAALGPLGLSGLSDTDAKSAKTFAAMPDEEWNRFLLDIHKNCAPSTALAEFRRTASARAGFDAGLAVASGATRKPRVPDDRNSLIQAASTILQSVTDEEEPFTVASAAQRLADYVQRDIDDPIDRLAMRQAIRLALQFAGEDDTPEGVPGVVTYFEDEVGWVRIPAAVASLEQFRFHVEYRERQARDMSAEASKLREVLDALTKRQSDNPALLMLRDFV